MGWVSIESRLALSAQDEEIVRHLAAASMALADLTARFPAVLHLLRDDAAGQPRSGLGRSSGDQDPWCWAHERPTSRCLAEFGWPCAGELSSGPSDPTGSAAVAGDRASIDRLEFGRDVQKLAQLVDRMVKRSATYPTLAVEMDTVDAGPGEEWCRVCWKDNKHCTPVTLKPGTRTPFYRGLCRWCGQTRREIGGDPPTWLVAMRHRGERIHEGVLAKARAELRSQGKKTRK